MAFVTGQLDLRNAADVAKLAPAALLTKNTAGEVKAGPVNTTVPATRQNAGAKLIALAAVGGVGYLILRPAKTRQRRHVRGLAIGAAVIGAAFFYEFKKAWAGG